jgi:hypothetical protein
LPFIAIYSFPSLSTGVERPIVLATEDNTNVYINNETTPIVLNKGQHVMIDSSKYIQASTTSDAYNMYIRADKTIYAYKLLGGVDNGNGSFSYASGGYNILPTLQCLLPKKIEEFAKVDEIGSQTGFDTRLNIITEAGATVKVNGTTLSATNGPFPVLGNSNWVTFMVRNVTGNVTIIY